MSVEIHIRTNNEFGLRVASAYKKKKTVLRDFGCMILPFLTIIMICVHHCSYVPERTKKK
jgi:hypothetical protein